MARATVRLTAKGEARRDALVEAAARLVAGHGPDALTHRAVATGAGVSAAATTYYFETIEDLLVAAVDHLSAAEAAHAESVVGGVSRRARSETATARLVVDVVLAGTRGDADLLARYERFLACGHHARLRPPLRSARARVDAALLDLLQRCGYAGTDVTGLVALVDGTVVSALVEGHGSARARAEAAVAAALTAHRARAVGP